MKKMVLVPYDFMEKINSQRTPLLSQISHLETEMQKIMSDKTIPADVKVKLYNQVLHKHSTLQSEHTKPVQLEISNNKDIKNDTLLRELQERMPKSKQSQVKRLIKTIMDNGNIKWNDRQEVIIDGTTLPNSNIESLVDFATRDVKGEPPSGWTNFLKWLADVNVPPSALGNKRSRIGLKNLLSPLPHLNFEATPTVSQTGSGKWYTVY